VEADLADHQLAAFQSFLAPHVQTWDMLGIEAEQPTDALGDVVDLSADGGPFTVVERVPDSEISLVLSPTTASEPGSPGLEPAGASDRASAVSGSETSADEVPGE
jgi:hypothetical protein